MKEQSFYIEEKTYDKILGYAHHAKNKFGSEIGGMCVVVKDEDGDYELKDPVILKQTISGGQCDLDKDELATYYTKADAKYYKEDYTFCWWHSHHTLGAFWSGTDTNTMKEASGSPFSYSLVVSWKKEPYEHIFRISYWHPYEHAVDMQLDIVNRKEKKVPKSLAKEVEAKCSETVVTSLNPYSNIYRRNIIGYNYNTMGTQNTLFDLNTVKSKKLPDYNADYGKVIDELNTIIDKTVDGRLTYAGYCHAIKNLNEELGSNHPISIKTLEMNELDDLLISTPSDFVDYDLTKDDEELDNFEQIIKFEGGYES
tara:strand:- start:963 stop:1898 length:936 start_codon:yes stop_codon:yes gene_type:complete